MRGWSRQEQQHSSGVEVKWYERRRGQSHLHVICVHPHSDLLIWANQTSSFRLSDCVFKSHLLQLAALFRKISEPTTHSGVSYESEITGYEDDWGEGPIKARPEQISREWKDGRQGRNWRDERKEVRWSEEIHQTWVAVKSYEMPRPS